MVNSISTQVNLPLVSQIMASVDAENIIFESLTVALFHLCFLSFLSVALRLVVLGQIGFIWASGERV